MRNSQGTLTLRSRERSAESLVLLSATLSLKVTVSCAESLGASACVTFSDTRVKAAYLSESFFP